MTSDYDKGSASQAGAATENPKDWDARAVAEVTELSPRSGSLESVRPLVVERDAAHGKQFELGLLWKGLQSGGERIVDAFTSEQRCYVVIQGVPASKKRRPLHGRTLEVVERVLLGQSAKGIAIDLGISPSTVSDATRSALRAIGVGCRASSLPILLSFSARAAHQKPPSPVSARVSHLQASPCALWVVSMARPERCLASVLSDAEAHVIAMLAEGLTHTQISRARGTSRRTIANQLSAAFRKLGASGRRELLNILINFLPRDARARETALLQHPALSA